MILKIPSALPEKLECGQARPTTQVCCQSNSGCWYLPPMDAAPNFNSMALLDNSGICLNVFEITEFSAE
ncbi:hypothetical protein Y1Q_0020703 [Alligator mississippiensis]|uniref:Uncharacterized protein n=1 Tax=Alligator mississippiensis TaxID=8496 RepID=A0A151MUV2_ALLMI|nr:hypothetical protein Y1Q_0020703 [Alligator mississippiensis]